MITKQIEEAYHKELQELIGCFTAWKLASSAGQRQIKNYILLIFAAIEKLTANWP